MPLTSIIEKAKSLQNSNETLLAIFDLDSTIFNVSQRSQQILLDFCKESKHLDIYPDQCKIMKDIKILPTDWGIKEPLSRLKIQATIDFFEDLRLYWDKHFFSNEYLKFDQPYDGAIEFVNKLTEFGVKIIYLTGRDQIRMGEGTVESIQHHKLPLDSNHRLILKPEKGMNDSKFKSDIIDELKDSYSEIWFFENEPVNTKLVEEKHKDVKIVFFDSVHSGREPTPDHHMTISHFNLSKPQKF